ncbi:butyrate kinase [bacterium]|nr:butyrate kinase [bacterium]
MSDINPEVVIAINPGSTSTKFALWTRQKCLVEKVVRHDLKDLNPEISKQLEARQKTIDEELNLVLGNSVVVAAVGRGGLLKPLPGGTYKVNKLMLEELQSENSASHASNLGAVLANYYADKFKVDAFIVDPVTVDEFPEIARVSGVPWIKRKSRVHALNIKAVVRRAAAKLDKAVNDSRFVVAHLGGGTSIAAVLGGKIIDVNDALHGMGPFSPERAGALPIGPLIERCFIGDISKDDLLLELGRKSGLIAYCGTNDVQKVLARAEADDSEADLALKAMMYQNAKEIGAMAAILKGKLDAVVITGGLANSKTLMAMLKEYVAFLAPVVVYPGEGELQALAEGAFRVIDKNERARIYE